MFTDATELNLLEKTELWVDDIRLEGADLNEIAGGVAEVLNMERERVLVVDVRDSHITLDLLKQKVKSRDIAGKEKQILRRLAEIPGIRLGEKAGIHSHGILGIIALPEADVEPTLQRSEQIIKDIRARISKRVKVFPTGFEVKKGIIKDTNSALISQELGQRGYRVTIGPIVDDDKEDVRDHIIRAIDEGFGLVITTGGVGAEDKDHTVEGVLLLDPDAATPWIAKYQKGSGRHVKEGVRIAVGRINETLIISLPGPNDEVKIALQAIIDGLAADSDKFTLAEKIAAPLREKLKAARRFAHHHAQS